LANELTNGQAGRAHWSLADAYVRVVTLSPTPLDGVYCNASAHWSVCQN